MFRLIVVFICCSFSWLTSFAQTGKAVDSLLRALDNAPTDSIRMNLYNKIGDYYMDNNAGKAINYLEKGRVIANKMELPLKAANNSYGIGFCYLIKGDFDKSLENYLEALRTYEKLKDSFRLSNTYMSIGNVYSQNKNYAKTKQYYALAQDLIVAQKDSGQLVNILAEIGMLYDQQHQYDSAIIYLKQSKQLAEMLHDKEMMANELSNIGLTYKHQQKTALALACFDSVLQIFKTIQAPVDNFAALYNNIAATNSQVGNYEKAKQAFNQSIAFAKQAGSPYIEMENYNNLADMYERMKNFELQSQYLKKFYKIKDSLFTSGNKNQLTQLEADYQVEKKNSEIALKDLAATRHINQRNILLAIALMAAFVLTTLALLYNRIKVSNRLLKDKNDQINQQNVELENLNQVKDRLFSIISHDLRNPLITLRTYLSLADDVTLSSDKKDLFKRNTMQAVSQTCDMLDNLLLWANLQIKSSNPNITHINVEECIQDALDTVNGQALQKQVTLETELQAKAAMGDYTILTIALRNLLTNAIKFSNAKGMVHIKTYSENEHVFIAVKDEGIGMTSEQLHQLSTNTTDSTAGTSGEKGSGLGVFLTKELLNKTDATLVIESEPENGSIFTIKMPAI